MSIWRVGALGFAAILACGPQLDSPERSTSATDEGASDPADASDDCGALTQEACSDEPGCEPLLAQQTFHEDRCVGGSIFVGCRAAACVEEQPCWICSDGQAPQLATQCGCLAAPWSVCEWDFGTPTECDCAPTTPCEESWKWCDEGVCRPCSGIDDDCDCFVSGCAPGDCCGWEGYCLAGDPLPDGSCPG